MDWINRLRGMQSLPSLRWVGGGVERCRTTSRHNFASPLFRWSSDIFSATWLFNFGATLAPIWFSKQTELEWSWREYLVFAAFAIISWTQHRRKLTKPEHQVINIWIRKITKLFRASHNFCMLPLYDQCVAVSNLCLRIVKDPWQHQWQNQLFPGPMSRTSMPTRSTDINWKSLKDQLTWMWDLIASQCNICQTVYDLGAKHWNAFGNNSGGVRSRFGISASSMDQESNAPSKSPKDRSKRHKYFPKYHPQNPLEMFPRPRRSVPYSPRPAKTPPKNLAKLPRPSPSLHEANLNISQCLCKFQGCPWPCPTPWRALHKHSIKPFELPLKFRSPSIKAPRRRTGLKQFSQHHCLQSCLEEPDGLWLLCHTQHAPIIAPSQCNTETWNTSKTELKVAKPRAQDPNM